MSADAPAWEQHSTARVVSPVQPRKLAKVPFVELADGRLQGVVSSGSDIERVYVSSVTAGTHTYDCSTNNNRPCGGLYGAPCKHLRLLVDEAVTQYGLDRVAGYLRAEVGDDGDLIGALGGGVERTSAAMVFSRFLRHLAYLELPGTTAPLPELHWFPAGEAR
ncbi:hypothetical protein ACWGH8_23275 [Nonomuraea muscovyensis]|uniref:Uncharacterized protein n=1 Tax=Nonomuraea muscovyensis TaxID=1124761 RepID=A0A7X0C064_9ACTN|nr:hypothetical protein [Nonomuraea muscovyensis]MBB6346164.1 hypothetical protein [Nonomuraea muscovyensis]MDF2712004.1 hypothetical protein [Nonomuraea muscovyensis]